MNKDNEAWYWDNVNAAIALTLVVAMIALCCWLAPDRLGKVTMYQNDNLTIQCIKAINNGDLRIAQETVLNIL